MIWLISVMFPFWACFCPMQTATAWPVGMHVIGNPHPVCESLWTTWVSYTCTRPYKIVWLENARQKLYNGFCACCPFSLAGRLLLVNMCIPAVSSPQWPCPSTTMCIISLHMSTKYGSTIRSLSLEILMFLCLLPMSSYVNPLWTNHQLINPSYANQNQIS